MALSSASALSLSLSLSLSQCMYLMLHHTMAVCVYVSHCCTLWLFIAKGLSPLLWVNSIRFGTLVKFQLLIATLVVVDNQINKFGSMVAFFRYSPIDIISVHLPPSVLEFNGHVQYEWTRKEAAEVSL